MSGLSSSSRAAIRWLLVGYGLALPAILYARKAVAVPSFTSPTPPPTLSHELFLLAAGAVFGALLGPIGQAILAKLLPSDDLRLRREELALLRNLISTKVDDQAQGNQGISGA